MKDDADGRCEICGEACNDALERVDTARRGADHNEISPDTPLSGHGQGHPLLTAYAPAGPRTRLRIERPQVDLQRSPAVSLRTGHCSPRLGAPVRAQRECCDCATEPMNTASVQ